MVRVFRGVDDRELHAFDATVESVSLRAVVRGDRGAAVLADVAAVVGGKDDRQRCADVSLADVLTIDVERRLAALAQTATGVSELHAHLVRARRDRPRRLDHEVLEPAPVVAILELAVLGIKAPAADIRSLGDDYALGAFLRHL